MWMDIFIHVRVPGTRKFEVCIEPSSLANEQLVRVCDLDLFTCRVRYDELRVLFGDVLGGVCPTCVERVTGIGVSVAQEDK